MSKSKRGGVQFYVISNAIIRAVHKAATEEPKPSLREIAARVGISHESVNKILEGKISENAMRDKLLR